MTRHMISKIALPITVLFVLVACSEGGDTGSTSGASYDASAETIEHGLLADKPYDGEDITFLICCPTAGQFVKWNESIAEFNELTGITVNFTNDPLDGLREKIITQSVGDPGSWDVTMYFDTWLPEMTRFLEPLDNVMPINLEDYPAVTTDLTQFDEIVYGIPVRSHVMLLEYRTDVFEELDLEIPETHEELLQTAQTISESDLDIEGFTMNWAKQPSISPMPWINFVQASGGSIFDENGKPDFTSPEVVAATRVYRDLVEYAPDGAVAFNEGDSRSAFAQGKAAMTLGWSWYQEVYTGPTAAAEVRDNVGFSAYTPSADGPGDPVAMTWPIGISSSSDHKGAAAEWVKWVTNPDLELSIIVDKSDPAVSTVVANRLSTLRDPAANEANSGFSEVMADGFERATHQPIYLGFSSVTEIIEVALSNIMTGADIDSTLSTAEAQATEELEGMRNE